MCKSFIKPFHSFKSRGVVGRIRLLGEPVWGIFLSSRDFPTYGPHTLIQIVYKRNQLSELVVKGITTMSSIIICQRSFQVHKAIQYSTRSLAEPSNISLFDVSISHIISWIQLSFFTLIKKDFQRFIRYFFVEDNTFFRARLLTQLSWFH